MAYVAKEQMNNASAVFNLLRNLGGSFGVAFVTALLARREQFHQYRLVEHLTPYDPGFTIRLEELKAALAAKMGAFGDHSQEAGGVIYNLLSIEADPLLSMMPFS